MAMTYIAHSQRYETMTYRQCGKSGLKLPLLSLGLWHNFGDTTPLEKQRSLLRTAFDLGITHFVLSDTPYLAEIKRQGDQLLPLLAKGGLAGHEQARGAESALSG